MPGPRRAQAMVNKEEKMNLKMNLEINDDMYVEKNEQRKKKQMIENEMDEDNHQELFHRQLQQQARTTRNGVGESAHRIPMALPQDSARGKALEEMRGQTGREARREQQRVLRTTRERPRPMMPKSRSSDTNAENARRSSSRGTSCSSTCARETT